MVIYAHKHNWDDCENNIRKLWKEGENLYTLSHPN